jgi:hypothetical protein
VPKASRANRSSAWLTALFFALLTVVGLLTSVDYGQPWDEPMEADILRMNGNQYLAAVGLEPAYTLEFFIDNPKSGLIADSAEKDHGVCAYYPLLWLVGNNSLSAATRMVVWHAYTWLWFMAGAAALWLICRRFGLSRGGSCVAVLFLVLTPRMFAEGHYNNKDMVLLSLTLLTLWLALRLMERPGVLRALFFSLAGAAATNTKIVGLFVWGLCALAVLVRQIAGRRMNRRAWGAALVPLVSFAGFCMLLIPASWADPPEYLRYVLDNAASFSRWQNDVLFRGAIFTLKTEHLPWYYLPYMILVTTPVWLLLLIAAGQTLAAWRFLRPRNKPFHDDTAVGLMLCTFLWLIPTLYAVLAHPILYNGWRHVYFIYGPLLALAAYGMGRVGDRLLRERAAGLRRAGAGLLALCMTATGVQIALSHPNQYAYYNALLYGKDVPEYMELDYWNVSTLQTLRSLLARLEPGQTVTIAAAESWSQAGLVSSWELFTAEERARLTVLPAGDPSAEYVLSNRTYAALGHWQAEAGMEAVEETESFGQPLCTIYARQTAGNTENVSEP